jgi:hypothetical protein
MHRLFVDHDGDADGSGYGFPWNSGGTGMLKVPQ